jgi:transglutaminase-like putative cysteine protease
MLIRVRHETVYHYEVPAKGVIQRVLLTPRNNPGQHVRRWRIEINHNSRLQESEDAFGNLAHRFYADGPIGTLATLAEGEVETFDTAGVVRGALERFPPEFYLRETSLTRPSSGLLDFARAATAREKSTLARLHALTAAIYESMTFDDNATHAATAAAEAFGRREGVCQDFAHIFVACARAVEIPARYVSGYFHRSDGVFDQAAGHAWAEAYIDDLGWVGFDPAHGISPDECYVRVAAALDYLGAAPVRGARMGGLSERMEVKVRVAMSHAQMQN